MTDLYGADIELQYDNSIAAVVDVNSGRSGTQFEVLHTFLDPAFVIYDDADNNAGSLRYAATQFFPSAPVDGSVPLAMVTRTATIPGEFTMVFSRTELSDIRGSLIPASWDPCVVTFTPWPPTAVQVSSTGLAPMPGTDWPVWTGLAFILAVATTAAAWRRRHEAAPVRSLV